MPCRASLALLSTVTVEYKKKGLINVSYALGLIKIKTIAAFPTMVRFLIIRDNSRRKLLGQYISLLLLCFKLYRIVQFSQTNSWQIHAFLVLTRSIQSKDYQRGNKIRLLKLTLFLCPARRALTS